MATVDRDDPDAGQYRRSLADQRREALDALQRATAAPSRELKEQVDVAERAVVRLRDRLIGWLRQHPGGGEAAGLPGVLERVNGALSLIAGVEYSAGGVQRRPLEEARDVIRDLDLE